MWSKKPLLLAMSDPLRSTAMSPVTGGYPTNKVFSTPVPRVSVMNSERKPNSPRVGT